VRGGDEKGTVILPGGSKKLLRRFDVDKDSYIELSGSGTCAGPENELTEFILEYKHRRGALARLTHIVDAKSGFQLAGKAQVTVEYDTKANLLVAPTSRSARISKVFEGVKAMVVGKRYRIPWQRPAKSSINSYTLGLAATKTGEQYRPDRKKEWKVQLKSKVDECFNPAKTILDMPETLGLRADMIGSCYFWTLKKTSGSVLTTEAKSRSKSNERR
jgi:hypothetical protein